jgi:hypothetical protein
MRGENARRRIGRGHSSRMSSLGTSMAAAMVSAVASAASSEREPETCVVDVVMACDCACEQPQQRGRHRQRRPARAAQGTGRLTPGADQRLPDPSYRCRLGRPPSAACRRYFFRARRRRHAHCGARRRRAACRTAEGSVWCTAHGPVRSRQCAREGGGSKVALRAFAIEAGARQPASARLQVPCRCAPSPSGTTTAPGRRRVRLASAPARNAVGAANRHACAQTRQIDEAAGEGAKAWDTALLRSRAMELCAGLGALLEPFGRMHVRAHGGHARVRGACVPPRVRGGGARLWRASWRPQRAGPSPSGAASGWTPQRHFGWGPAIIRCPRPPAAAHRGSHTLFAVGTRSGGWRWAPPVRQGRQRARRQLAGARRSPRTELDADSKSQRPSGACVVLTCARPTSCNTTAWCDEGGSPFRPLQAAAPRPSSRIIIS